MTPDQATDLAARTLDAIDAEGGTPPTKRGDARRAADRERVWADLAAIMVWHGGGQGARGFGWLHYAEGNLRRTARLYGVDG